MLEKGNVSFLVLVCFVASLGGVLFGFDTAVISGTFSFVEQHFTLDKIEVGWFASSALVGAADAARNDCRDPASGGRSWFAGCRAGATG